MKKINSNGFVLAETLVVTVFLLVIFGMIYSEFYPLIGEYEKREVYDEVDGKYALYWIKKIIEDSSYNIEAKSGPVLQYLGDGTPTVLKKIEYFQSKGYVRFECEDVVGDNVKRNTCINLVKSLEINNCDKRGNNCDIFITKYQLKGSDSSTIWFKDIVKTEIITHEKENCVGISATSCKNENTLKCKAGAPGMSDSDKEAYCNSFLSENVFTSGLKDYIDTLADFTTPSLNGAKYRIIAVFHHRKDNNNYYSYATMEVNK